MYNTGDTLDTTRVYAENSFTSAALVSQMTFPDKMVPWMPSAVVLAPSKPYHYSFIASSIIHFPINASFLFTRKKDCLTSLNTLPLVTASLVLPLKVK